MIIPADHFQANADRESDSLEALMCEVLADGLDVSPCGVCEFPVVCIPDGLPMCARCAGLEAGETQAIKDDGSIERHQAALERILAALGVHEAGGGLGGLESSGAGTSGQ